MFASRKEAGHWLARTLEVYRRDHPVVLAVPGGGVPVAREVSEALDAPLDAVVVQKVPAPGLLDLTLATLTEDGTCVPDDDLIAELGIKNDELNLRLCRQRGELKARVQRIRGDGCPMDLEGRTAILVHDGIQAGGEAEATVMAARQRGAARVVLTTPVSTLEVLEQLSPLVDDLAWLRTSTSKGPIGFWYQDRFDDGDDEAVARVLRERAERPRTPEPLGHGAFGENLTAGFPISWSGRGWTTFAPEAPPVPIELHDPSAEGRRRLYIAFP